jgi:hypothetical protein
MVTERDADVGGYVVKKLAFSHQVAPIFGPLLFELSVRGVRAVSLIGGLLELVLGLTLA